MQKYECLPQVVTLPELQYFPVYMNSAYCGPIGEQAFHSHSFIEICYIDSGGGYHQIRDKVFPCRRGDIYMINVGVPHAFFMSQKLPYSDLHVKNLIFLPEFLLADSSPDSQITSIYHQLSTEVLTDDTSVIQLTMNEHQLDEIERLYNNIREEYDNHQNGTLALIRAMLTIFIIKLARYLQENEDSVIPYRYSAGALSIVEEIRKYIEEDFGNPELTISMAADRVYIGKSYLSRIFKKYTGQYFSDFLRDYRMTEACRLLRTTSMTNEEISRTCGFRDLPTFYRHFKQFTGCTPKAYYNHYAQEAEQQKGASEMETKTTIPHEMNGVERCRRAILGQEVDRTPIYGWVSANLGDPINRIYGSVAAFEEKYEFDIAHLFAGPGPFNGHVIDKIRAENEEFTPDLLVDADIFTDPDTPGAYLSVKNAVEYYRKWGRFCYIQTPGFFENFNGVFGIENQLLWLAAYPDELSELYARQADWTIRFADHCIDAGVDMVHVSDDWGAQRSLMFDPALWRRIVKPNLKKVADHVHERGSLISLHSDGCVSAVTDDLAEIGIDCIHPWQETAGMSYDVYREKYQNSFAILGGVCVQSTIGFGDLERLEAEIRRVFGLLRGKRWILCTTHFVQEHCSIEELAFAYDLIYKLARGEA